MRTNRNEKIHLFCRLVVITNNKNQIRPVVHIRPYYYRPGPIRRLILTAVV